MLAITGTGLEIRVDYVLVRAFISSNAFAFLEIKANVDPCRFLETSHFPKSRSGTIRRLTIHLLDHVSNGRRK